MEKLAETPKSDLLPDWSEGPAWNDPGTLLHEAFEAQAARTPEALALVGEDGRSTYRELEERANRLARHLRSLGVGPEVRVGVCLERSTDLVVGLLAVLKAGGAYVPLDPLYPPQRIAHMLDDSRAEVVVTQELWLDVLPASPERRLVLVDAQRPEIAAHGAARPERLGVDDNLAYLIYTSGSTGLPKGVAIEHRSAVALLRWAAEVFSPRDLSGVMAATSVCFDLSVFEIFVPLALGGTVIVAGNALDLPYLPADPPVTLVNTVPSAMAELVRTRRVPASVRVVNLAGEALPGALVEEIYRTTRVERVYNLYGPSEDTTYSTEALVPRDASGAPPIGRPLPGTRAWLLDRDGLPAPSGEEGELYLAGEGLARGYLGRPELTAERFVPDPFAGEPGERLYRTGDLARHLPDGQLHYLGRADHQVKIRGFRIELGEIEGTLARHPAVREAAVLAEDDETAGKRLVAFLAVDGEMPGTGDLRTFLGRTLPEYMVPSLFRRVDALPRTLNGKVDRRALAALGRPAAVPAAVPEGLCPLSFAQRRLWFSERLKPGEPTYNEPLAFDLAGPVDRAALAAALGEIVRRHEILRTRYVEVAGTPFQEVLPVEPFTVPFVDLGALPEEVRETGLLRALAAEIRRPFDFGRPPLLRAALFGRGGAEHTLVFTIHHIAYDGGRTRQILVDELSALYGAAREGRPSPLPPPAAQYGDFARREHETWKGIPAGRLEEWRRLLAGAPALVPPGDRPRPAVRTSRGVTVRFLIPADRVAVLRSFARAEGGTLFKALFALLAALLGRATGRRDGVIGTTVAGRTGPGAADTMGFFINLLPIRVDLSGSPGLRALLARVRSVVDEAAAAREDLPYEQLVAALRPARGAEGGTLFEVLVQRLPTLLGPALPGLQVTRRPVDNGTAKFVLEATLEETGEGVEGFLQGSADLYEAATLDRFAARFRALLEAAIADPDRPLDEVPLPFEEEQRALVAAEPVAPVAPEPAPGRPTPTGELLARIWCDVLGLPSVAPGDDFFHLGGHSLLGASVLSRVRDLLGVDLPVQALFRAPTVEGLAATIADALRGGGRPAPPPVLPVPRGEPLPLSFAQERFWFLERLSPGSAAYNVPLALRLEGRLDAAALEAALCGILRRHEALSTRFAEASGRRFQEVLPVEGFRLARIDLSGLPEGERRAELDRVAREEAAMPFDLGRPPLLRARLVGLGEGEHAFLLTVHHAVFDGGSQGIVNREISTLYAAAREGRAAALPDLPVQYADFAVWQRSWLTREVLDGLLAWWRRELEGAPAVLDLPADRPRPRVQALRGARERADLPPELAEGVASLARRFGVTRFMVLLAAFQTLLSRLSGQDDLLVGSPSANRPRPELEGVVGLFVETLPLRARLAGDPPFHGLLARVRETALAAFAHQDLPFERLVAGLGVERSSSHSPLIQTMFTLQDALEEGLALPGLAVYPLASSPAAAKLDLALIVEEGGGRLQAVLEHDTDLFEAVTARRLLARYLSLLSGAAGDPALRLADLPLLSAAERHQLLSEWNDTAVAVPGEPSLLRQIEERARRAPEAPAVAQGGRLLTYGELDLRAGRLAERLRRLGVGPETRVAVCLPRSPEAVASLLAVWKAGGAYVTLDPAHPAERLATVLADSGAPVLIARGDLAAALAREGVWVVDPDDGEEPSDLGEAPAGALAYVIYTSGSTGRPKGVEVSHASLANLVAWHRAAYGLTAADRTTLLARVGFDASVWELWPTLAAGASLWLPEEDALSAPEALRDGIVEQGITVSFVPTPLAELLLGLEWPERTALRAMLTGGDALRRRPSPGLPFALVNHYGPTEATVVTTAGPVAAEGASLPTIGRPIAGARVYVVDAGLSPLPPGAPGELCIGGSILARGYLGSPELTAERYVPDPFAAEPGVRLYRTGDLVRLENDGRIEFLGRLDRQVKLRGLRLELGEIEAALARHPAVREAAVIVAEGGPGGARLVAFATLRREPAPPASEVFDLLRRSLPDYMVPAAFVPLSEMPLTANGKVDRRALAGKVPAETGAAAGEAPATPAEELIAQIWCEVLGLPAVGPGDDFFRLGGHSLLAASVLSRIRDAFGVSLPVQALFERPTVAALAGAVFKALRGGGPALPPVERAPRRGPLPLSFAQERFWFLDRLGSGGAVYNIPLAFRLLGRLDPAALRAALSEVVRRHEALRTRFVELEGELFQEAAPAGVLALPWIDLGSLPEGARGAELARLGRAEATAPFDLGAAPQLRTRLVHLGAEENALLLTVHHAAFDGGSQRVLERELSLLYAAALSGAPSPLPEPAIQYADFAVWQRSWLAGEVLDRLLAWWRRELDGAPTVLALPADRPRPEVQAFRGAVERLELPEGVTERVAALGRSLGATRFMVLLAAFQAWLHRLSGQEDLLVGTPSSHRPRPELEELIGLFVETVVLRGHLEGDPSLAGLAARVRETALGAFAHQDLPFERLVAGLGVERSPSHNPLIQVMFAFQGGLAQGLALPGIVVEPLDPGSVVAKFDLTLSVEEAGGTLRLFLEYDSGLFEAVTARRFLARFATLLAGAVDDPATPLSAVAPLSDAERRQLAAARSAPGEPAGAAGPGGVASGETRELVAGIWREVLGLASVDPRDNFFHLGGHSLLGARVLARIREACGVDLPMRELFRAPTLEGLATVVDRARGREGAAPPPVFRVPRDRPLPLSFAQERFWFLDRLDAGGAAYNVPLAFRLAGRLAPAALEAGLREVVRRHEALRTRFVERDGHPLQEAVPGALPGLPRIDLSSLPEEARRAELGRLCREEGRTPFALTAAPLLRARLLGLSPHEHVLLLTLHHAVCDGWSLGVLHRELSALYAAALAGRPSPLPELAFQYADYAVWQRSWLTGEVLEGLLAWWRRELDGAPTVLDLPADRPRPEVQAFRGAVERLELPAGIAAGVAALGRSHGVTRFMVLLAAFQALLARWTGQDDLVVGSPSANRPRPELEGLIGFFVETVALRGRLGGDPTVGELLARTRETALGAFAHQDLPFERLIAGLGVERSPSRNPLVQAMFSLEEGMAGRLSLPGLAVQPLVPVSATSKVDLILIVETAGEGLRVVLEHDSDLFEAVTARRLLAHFATLLAGAAADPTARLSELPLLSAAERHQLSIEWNDAAAEVSPAIPLHRRIEEWALRAPDALAVARGDQRMTYGELDRRAGRLARRLARLGVGPEVRVAVCLPRSPEGIAALLAVWKVGGAYVALDPTHPVERLAGMLEDAGAPVLVARGPVAAALARERLHVLDPDDGDEEGPLPAEACALPDAVAYVVYTSGSTGRPKGVEIGHRALLNFVESNRRASALGPADRVALAAPVAWDGAVFEIWPALASGASLHAPEDDVITAPEALRDWMVGEGVTVAFLTTALAELLAGLPWPEGASLRILETGGDVLRRRPAPSQPFTLMNCYGPTETTVIVTGVRVGPEGEGRPTIGRPLPNVRAYVVDPGLRAVPAGVPGELAIGGVQVSRGYLGHPAATAERYAPDPFAAEPGERLYRTGDLVRFCRGGEIEFLGRIDRQVKLRGNRLELDEIEAALQQHPALCDAAVIVAQGSAGSRLVAFGTLRREPAPPAEEVFSFLRRSLPDFMIPAVFVPSKALPRTPNGKIDRHALAARVPEEDGGADAPSSPAAELMTQVWARVLGLPAVGPRDHFFRLGGHSLLATSLLAQVRDTFGVSLPVRDLFSRPTPEGLAVLVAEARRDREEVAAPPIRPVPRGGALPLSFAQEALWFIHALDPASSVYQIPSVWRLEGALDATALEAALAAVARRHEALRTRFPRTASGPVQEIGPGGLPLPRIDLAGLPAGAREEELARLLRAEAGAPFDLECGPLARARLALLSPGEHALLFTVHHAVFDGWSLGLFQRELEVFYEAAVSGAPAVLPALPVQYADFAVWQRSWLAGEALARRVAWWRRELGGAPAVLDLPTDRPRPRVQTFRGAWELLELPADRMGEVRALGRGEGATLFMILLAVFQTLLHRLADQDDVLVGSPVSNRSRPEIEGLLGYFVDTVVLRGRFGHAGETVRQVLARVRETALDVFAHQDLPFERLVSELKVERDLAYNPLFQAMLSLAPPGAPLSLPGVAARPLTGAEPPAMFDLTLGCEEQEGRLAVSLEFNTDLYDRATARRLLERFATLLAAFAADPGQRVEEIPLLTGAELQELVAAASRSAGPPPEPRLLHQLLVDQAARTPDAVAVLTPAGAQLTYAEVARQSARLARFLRRRGVGPDVPVGVCLERSPELVVALFGILRAGGVYLPLDPAYPPERLAFLLEDSGAPLVLTRSRQSLPQGLWEIVALDAPDGPLAGDDVPAPPETALPEGLAYLIYTSGSTGRPKAVGVSHAVAAEHLEIAASLFGLGAGDRFLQFSSPSFDMALEEIVAPLLRGSTLILREAELWEPATLLDRLIEHGVTAVNLPTAYWQQWAAELEDTTAPAELPLRLVVVGGEGMSGEAARRWGRSPLATRVRLLNAYGPTEAVITSTVFEPGAGAEASVATTVPIGHPIPGRSAWVLDRSGQPVPAGVPGELCLGGPLLARGYAGRPDLTAERFVPDPFAGEPGARLYRTGDRVRRRTDGVLDFLGRIDRQVKVRGFRIELGEVEAALARHPAVREAVVDLREDLGLVAWIVPAPPAEMRDFLRASLPEPLIPAAFVAVPELPLTPNGKVDRRALPALVAAADEAPELPRDPVEEMVAAVWMDVLGLARAGRHDNFFELGGHSLRATQLASRLRQAFDADLPLRAIFEDPTPARLAARIRSLRGGGGALLPPVTLEERPERIPLSFSQQRLWFLDRLAPNRAVYNVPVATNLSGPLAPAALEAALTEVFHRHEALRTRFVERDGQPWQEIAPPGPVALPRVDLGALPPGFAGAERDRLGREEARRPFDLARGPLLRFTLIRLEDEEHTLLLTAHHIVSDAWSEGVLGRELSLLYTAASEGLSSPLPELPIQYADFALWQRRHIEDLLGAQLEHWRRQLDGLATLELPTDRPRPPVQSFRGALQPVRVPEEVAAALREISRRRGATLFMVLLAAWQTLLGRLSGQTDVAVGSPVANRNRAEIEGLIGFFINMLAFRGDLGGDPPFEELLARVRRTALDAYGHQDVPFERLVDELRPERDLSRQPLVQVMIAVEEGTAEPMALPGIAAEPLATVDSIAKFDLTLYLGAEEGGFAGAIEHASDLFDAATVRRWAGHLVHVLAEVAARPEVRLSEIGLLSPAERHQVVLAWNDTRAPFPEEKLLHQFFEARVDAAPGAVAAVWEGRELTYGELEARANRIAGLLRDCGVERGAPVGVWMERSLDMLAAVLGALKAGGWYLPLDGAWPAERVEAILAGSGAPAILTRSSHLGPLLDLRWRLPALADVICLDVETPEPAPEPLDPESVRALFDLVAERAVDRATAGGFVSSFTSLPFSKAEVDEYRDRVVGLAEPFLRPDARVLEIGSGSGLLLWEIAPRVSRYVGLDPSPLTQERNRARAAELGFPGVELPVGFAHEIEVWPEGSFDLVILASTVQFFPGPLYLERIVDLALRRLAPGGALLVADVPDARRRDELRRVRDEHRSRAGLPPLDSERLLSLDEDLFGELAGRVSVLHRRSGFDNELRFRYDVLVEKGEPAPERPRRKRLWTSWHVERRPADRPRAVASPEDVAYVIHTSGSTGQPKGIVVQHRPVANLIHWINGAFGLGPSDRVLFVTSLCFDLSVWDIFGLLAAGGTVHVASEDDLRDAERLVRMLVEEPITVWDSAPAALVRLAPLFPAEPAVGSRLRRVMLSGDWIPVTLPDRVRAAFPGAEVTSLGGATEATVWSNWYPIGEVDPRWPSIPYGRPIANARYHVLDAGLSPCPVGVPGDLYIGGDCLCVGYAQEPALTAAAFLPDPFNAAPGARLYRTGDRARFFADGNLEFLGRVDQQVKIRGFRIELGEIEVALVRHPALREAVVLAREDTPGDKRLVAYAVPSAGASAPAAGELRDFLRRTLPEYMVPAAFVTLSALPVTANGKLDRRALPAPRWESSGEEEAVQPLSPAEESLAALWREVLGVSRVGRDDNFFDLGGHSLLATQLVARLREASGAEVPLRAVFQAPTLAELAAVVGAGITGRATVPRIRPVPRESELPLSASQLRQWFLVQLEPESTGYNIPIFLRLEGALRPGALAAALGEIARRHETLRTTFPAVGGRPVALVSPTPSLPLPLADVGALPEAAREAEAARLAVAALERPFDVAQGPLARALLVRLAPGDHLFAFVVHHIVFDGWSMGVFLRELTALYEANASGRPSRLPGLPVQYVDYAAWQREWLTSTDLEAQVAHWKRRLTGSSRTLDLPTDRPRPAVLGHHGALVPLAVSDRLAAGLKAFAGREGSTLFMLLLAGYAALLSRYSGQDDFNVGTFVANRRQEVLERLIGFFVNTLVLRTDLTGDPGFGALLARVREATLDAFEHQEVPFESLLEALETGRDLSRTPFFQVMFGVQNFAVPSLEVPGLAIRQVNLEGYDRTNTDLVFWMWEEGSRITGWIQLNTDLFDGSTVARMFGHMTNLLAAAVAAPEIPLSELPLLGPEERQQILTEWGLGGDRPASPRPVHERMRGEARRAPDAAAAVAGDRVLSYGDLDRRAGRVARGLRRLGAGPGTVVGVCIDRTPEMLVALYGILGAGAAYLPLDPKLPAERVAALVEDAGAPWVLSRRGLADALPPLPARALFVDLDFEGEAGDGLPDVFVAPESAAYVLYTSGSTGTPKGVVVEHRALAGFVDAARETYGIGPEDRVLQFASLSFDTSVEEIYPCLAAGGTLVLRDEEMLASPAFFLAACGRLGVTVLDLPTAYWHELAAPVASGAAALPPSLRLVILGGERALPERVHGWLAAAGPRPCLVNTYGPTEATVIATVCDLAAAAPAVPIGRPIHGAEVYLLDRDLRPVPAGVPGEIVLGGGGLARGYLGRPDLTAERFVPSPFGPPGARLYRTGDLGRWLSSGQLDFAGRVDDQVKIRGFRIEPGEIAAALACHPAVREAVVIARETGPGERRLAAYAVPAGGDRPSPSDLRAFLKERLPDYMVPADILLLPAFPLTRTGKVDRRALPAPEASSATDEGYAPPETPSEEIIAGLWTELLGLDRPGIYDNFFDVGGHSLLAPQLFSRIEEVFGIELPLRILFEAPTIAQLANAVEGVLLAQIEELSEDEAAVLIGGDLED